VDLTEIARRYGWERLPALVNWRTYYAGARFNQFVMPAGLDWYRAMAEVYPPEALITPTLRPTYTPTVTETPEFFGLFTATPTPLPTETPTRRPTWTPLP
jgi:TolB protein